MESNITRAEQYFLDLKDQMRREEDANCFFPLPETDLFDISSDNDQILYYLECLKELLQKRVDKIIEKLKKVHSAYFIADRYLERSVYPMIWGYITPVKYYLIDENYGKQVAYYRLLKRAQDLYIEAISQIDKIISARQENIDCFSEDVEVSDESNEEEDTDLENIDRYKMFVKNELKNTGLGKWFFKISDESNEEEETEQYKTFLKNVKSNKKEAQKQYKKFLKDIKNLQNKPWLDTANDSNDVDNTVLDKMFIKSLNNKYLIYTEPFTEYNPEESEAILVRCLRQIIAEKLMRHYN